MNPTYDQLVKEGKINLTDQQKAEFKRQAVKNFFLYTDEADKKYKLSLTHEQQERFIVQNAKKLSVANFFNNEK